MEKCLKEKRVCKRVWKRVDLGGRDANESCGLENRGFERRKVKVGFETGIRKRDNPKEKLHFSDD